MTAAPSVVQTAVTDGGSGTPTVVTVTYALAQTAGNLNIVCIAWDDTASGPFGTLVDSSGNLYSQILTIASDNESQVVYISNNIKAAGAGANTVTATWASGTPSFPEVYIIEVKGQSLLLPIPASQAAIATNPATALGSAGPVTTDVANSLAFGYCFNDNAASGAGTGWTLDSKSVTSFGSALETQVIAAKGTPVTATTPILNTTRLSQSVFVVRPPFGSYLRATMRPLGL